MCPADLSVASMDALQSLDDRPEWSFGPRQHRYSRGACLTLSICLQGSGAWRRMRSQYQPAWPGPAQILL